MVTRRMRTSRTNGRRCRTTSGCTSSKSDDAPGRARTTGPSARSRTRGEKARRRDPRRFNYCGAACPEFRKGSCPRSDACEFAHGVFECWLHPSRYRTQLCKDGAACNRRACFFAHHSSQLRPATDAFGNPLASPRDAHGGGLAGGRHSTDGMSGGHGGYEQSPPGTGPGSNARTPRQSHDGGAGAGAGAAAQSSPSSDAFAAAVSAAAAALLAGGGGGYLPPYAGGARGARGWRNGTPLNRRRGAFKRALERALAAGAPRAARAVPAADVRGRAEREHVQARVRRERTVERIVRRASRATRTRAPAAAAARSGVPSRVPSRRRRRRRRSSSSSSRRTR
jgi:hypothetical protein